ncbi:MAG: hypothetical protein J6I53_11275 [Treponema sp.]|nr:hypothetical protein [Treponema sp.]
MKSIVALDFAIYRLPLAPKWYGSGIAFTETRSKPVSQVLPAKAVAP